MQSAARSTGETAAVKHPILRLEEISDELYRASDLRIEQVSDKRLWLFDLEATGLDTTRERITQIAGIPLQGGELIEDEAFVEFVSIPDDVEIPKVVEDLTGITREHLLGAPSFANAWRACVDAAGSADVWIGQSVFEFDVPILETEMARHGMPVELPPTLDSVVMATHLLGPPEGRWSTSALIDRFAVDVSGLRRHDALDDVRILGRILKPMLELVRAEHGDALVIPAESPVDIKRHAPVRS